VLSLSKYSEQISFHLFHQFNLCSIQMSVANLSVFAALRENSVSLANITIHPCQPVKSVSHSRELPVLSLSKYSQHPQSLLQETHLPKFLLFFCDVVWHIAHYQPVYIKTVADGRAHHSIVVRYEFTYVFKIFLEVVL